MANTGGSQGTRWLAGFLGGIAPTGVFIAFDLVSPVFTGQTSLPAYLLVGWGMIMGIALGVLMFGGLGAGVVRVFEETDGKKAFFLGAGAPGLVMAALQGALPASAGASAGTDSTRLPSASFWPAAVVPELHARERTALAAQDSVSVRGRVFDVASRQPVEGATVMLVRPRRLVISGRDGRFVITGVPLGEVELTARAIGFAPQTIRITARRGDDSDVELGLRAQAVEVEAITVNVGLPDAQFGSERDVRIITSSGPTGRLTEVSCGRGAVCVMEIVPTGATLQLSAFVDGLPSNTLEVASGRSDTVNVTLKVEDRGFLAGLARSLGLKVSRYTVNLASRP